MTRSVGTATATRLDRRQLLSLGGAGALSLFWARWLQADESAAAVRGRAKSVILIFNCGGPSHLDLWDMKPEAPDSVRGPFRPISTNVPGMDVSELMPDVARHAEKLAIVRTVHHGHAQHNSGMYWSIVGQPYGIDSTLINPSRQDHPSLGTLVGWLAQRDGYSGRLPPYVITPAPHCDSPAYVTPGQFGGFLGPRYDPFVLDADPNAADFRVRNVGLVDGVSAARFGQRRELLGELQRQAQPVASAEANQYALHQAQAMSLVQSGEMSRAFDLSHEPEAVRERYGRHSWGQSHLLARRLVEAGVPFVTTVNGPSIVWDTHENNFVSMKDRLVPPMQQAYAALLEDLDQRGLLESTVVVWMGDFGRTPTINKTVGRDHWPQCFSMVLAGGGIRGGQVVGQSDRTASYPLARPVTPADIHATVFRALGYLPDSTTFMTPDGRPMPLSEGHPLEELL